MKKLLLLLLLPITIFAQVGDDELVNPKDLIYDIVIDLRYSTPDHSFLNIPGIGAIYKSQTLEFLRYHQC